MTVKENVNNLGLRLRALFVLIIKTVNNPELWLRGLFILIFGVILYFAVILVMFLVVFHFVSKLLMGYLNRQLADFSVGLTRYISQILGYITFQSDERPFPFNPWPEAEKPTAAAKPKPRRRTTRSPARKKEAS